MGSLMSTKKIFIGEMTKIEKSFVLNVRVVDVEHGVSEFAEYVKSTSMDIIDDSIKDLTTRLPTRILSGLAVNDKQKR